LGADGSPRRSTIYVPAGTPMRALWPRCSRLDQDRRRYGHVGLPSTGPTPIPCPTLIDGTIAPLRVVLRKIPATRCGFSRRCDGFQPRLIVKILRPEQGQTREDAVPCAQAGAGGPRYYSTIGSTPSPCHPSVWQTGPPPYRAGNLQHGTLAATGRDLDNWLALFRWPSASSSFSTRFRSIRPLP